MKSYREFNKTYSEFTFKPYDSLNIKSTNKILYLNTYKKIQEIEGLHPYMTKKLDSKKEKITLNVIILDMDNELDLVDKLMKIGNAFNILFDMELQSISESDVNDILNKNYLLAYNPVFNKTISYDFDGVLHKSIRKGTIHPIDYWDYDNVEPNMELIEKINEQSKTHTIVVVTARHNDEVSDIWRFLKKYNINIYEVFTCNMNEVSKPYILKSIGAIQHYDDNKVIMKDVEKVGVVFNYVNTNKYF
jgi:hypothetical protein